jgi:hypothetical protein
VSLTILASAVAACTSLSVPFGERTISEPIDRWVSHAVPTRGSRDRTCAQNSLQEWRVVFQSGRVRVTPSCGSECYKHLDAMVMVRGVPPGAISAAADCSDGWLIGMDGGEFGGALWWLPTSGDATRLIDRNVRNIVVTGASVSILTGLEHGDRAEGMIYRGKRRGRGWAFEWMTDLKAGGEVATTSRSGSVTALTSNALVRLNQAGEVTKLADADYQDLEPNSIVGARDGSFYVGMRHFVLRLWEHRGRWHEEWLVPKECTEFVQAEDDCLCKGRSSNGHRLASATSTQASYTAPAPSRP